VAERIAAAGQEPDPGRAKDILRKTFAATTELEQATRSPKNCRPPATPRSLVKHLGVVARWHVVGPFPVSPETG
jgi:hypothetical protein